MQISRTFHVVAAGLAYVDEIYVDVPTALLTSYQIPLGGGRHCSNPLLDEIGAASGMPAYCAGGSSANTIAAIAAMGGKGGYFGKVGRDQQGETFLTDFNRRGIPLLCDPYTDGASGTARCLVLCSPAPLRERSFAYNDGCAHSFSSTDFAHFDFASTCFLLIEALLLQEETARGAIADVMRTARGRCQIAVSLHGTRNWQARRNVAHLIARSADLICGNAEEQRDFNSACRDHPLPHPQSQMRITTNGEHGARVESDEMSVHNDAVVIGSDVFVNTVGAGDAFLGGFLLAAAGAGSPRDCLQRGAEAAAAMLKLPNARLA